MASKAQKKKYKKMAWVAPVINVQCVKDALPKEEKPFEVLKSETVLPDDYPVYGNFAYIIDSKKIVSSWINGTVKDLKKEYNATEVRRCEIFARMSNL